MVLQCTLNRTFEHELSINAVCGVYFWTRHCKPIDSEKQIFCLFVFVREASEQTFFPLFVSLFYKLVLKPVLKPVFGIRKWLVYAVFGTHFWTWNCKLLDMELQASGHGIASFWTCYCKLLDMLLQASGHCLTYSRKCDTVYVRR